MKIFIADDSITYRSQIEKQLILYPQVEVVGSSRISLTTFSIIASAEPDLVVLDLGESIGFDLLRQIQSAGLSTKVLGLATSSEQHRQALSVGCRDVLDKLPKSGERDGSDSVRVAQLVVDFTLGLDAGVMVERAGSAKRTRPGLDSFEPGIVVIASSTGGPPVLERIFAGLKGALKIPVLITQHMPESFTKDLSIRLSSVSHNLVREAVDGEEVKVGTVYVAPGNFHMRLAKNGRRVSIALDQGEKLHSVRPAADYLFKTAADIYGKTCMGFVLTGMGSDGAEGARYIKDSGGKIMIQDKESAAVWGMPGAAHALGAFDAMGSIDAIATTFAKMVMRKTV